jgi:hypothetical protein
MFQSDQVDLEKKEGNIKPKISAAQQSPMLSDALAALIISSVNV